MAADIALLTSQLRPDYAAGNSPPARPRSPGEANAMHNLLAEPLIRYAKNQGGVVWASLPEIYAALMHDQVVAFPALRPHQRHAWHAFLVQLAAMAMRKSNINNPPETPAEWETLIRKLTPGFPNDEPWRLVVDDIAKPAFMQPPASSAGKLAEYKTTVTTPDELDMLVTSKNHDVKSGIAAHSDPDEWLIALITLQTMEGYSGVGNYGVSRMNGGLGNRPAFSLAPTGGTGAHIRRDILALLADYSTASESHSLLWILPWDGAKSERLLPDSLASLYIEVCRRVRMRSGENGQLCAIKANSEAARIENEDIKGRVNDPWTPHNTNRDGLPLTLSSGGFTYKRVKEYLLDWRRPALLKPSPAEQKSTDTMQLVARAMVRGQGKTEGYHERAIPLRSKTRNAMLRSAGRDSAEDLGSLAQKRIEEISKIQRILSHAIQTFASGGGSGAGSSELRALARPWLNKLDGAIDHRFFDDLQDEFETNDNAERERIHNEWLQNFILPQARSVLSNAMDSLPCRAIHRYRARVNAESLFEGRIRGNNGLPFLFNNHKESNE